MVERHETVNTKKPLVAVDLDGTLVKGNTFRIFIHCGLKHLASEHKYINLLTVLSMLGLRKLGLISHRYLKFKALPIIGENDELKESFTGAILPLLNEDVTRLLDSYKADGYDILLATAAADTYVPWIYNGDYQATRIKHNQEHAENRGELKLQHVLEYAEARNLELKVVLTDHYDDCPLLEYGAYNILVCPSHNTLNRLQAKNVRIDRII